MPKIVVTGGTGFIGSHLVKKLVEEGEKVIVVDDLSSGKLENLSGLGIKPSDFEFRKTDLADYSAASAALKDGEAVFHLAARIGGIKYLHEMENAELLALEENMAIDANVFRVCRGQRVESIIYASSCAVYPLEKQYAAGAVFSEKDFEIKKEGIDPKFGFKMSINPDGGYGLTKLLGEVELNLMKNTGIGIARIFNIYGENEPLDQKSHAISDLIRKAMDFPKKDFVIWGSGEQTRDYLYVSDCAEALVKIWQAISGPNRRFLTVNVASGQAVSINKLAEKAIEISGKKIEPKYDLQAPVGPISRTANINIIKKELNWQPKTTFDEGLKKTYFWIEKKLNRQ